MSDGSSLPGDLPSGTLCADDLLMVLREYILEMKIVQQDAQYLESLFSMLSTQQRPNLQNKVLKETATSVLEGDRTSSSRHASNSSRSGMLEPTVSSDACIIAANNNVPPSQQEFVMEPAAQIIQNTMEGIVIESKRSPPPRVQSTAGLHVGEQLPPLPEGPIRAPNAAVSSLLSCAATAPVAPSQLDPSVTTLCIRSIPRNTSKEDLLALWPPTWGYDFLYLPYNPKQRRSAGYVFINFVSHEAAKLFYSRWEGQILTLEGHTRALSVQAACVQGLMEILEHLVTQGISQVRNHRHLPTLFAGVDRISFRAVLNELQSTRCLSRARQ